MQTTTAALNHRDRAVLRAVAAGRCEISSSGAHAGRRRALLRRPVRRPPAHRRRPDRRRCRPGPAHPLRPRPAGRRVAAVTITTARRRGHRRALAHRAGPARGPVSSRPPAPRASPTRPPCLPHREPGRRPSDRARSLCVCLYMCVRAALPSTPLGPPRRSGRSARAGNLVAGDGGRPLGQRLEPLPLTGGRGRPSSPARPPATSSAPPIVAVTAPGVAGPAGAALATAAPSPWWSPCPAGGTGAGGGAPRRTCSASCAGGGAPSAQVLDHSWMRPVASVCSTRNRTGPAPSGIRSTSIGSSTIGGAGRGSGPLDPGHDLPDRTVRAGRRGRQLHHAQLGRPAGRGRRPHPDQRASGGQEDLQPGRAGGRDRPR